MSAVAGAEQSTERVEELLAESNTTDERRKRRRWMNIWLVRITLVVVVVGVWEWLSSTRVIDPMFFSAPSAIYAYLVEFVASGEVWYHTMVTLREMLWAFSIGSVTGVTMGLLLASLPWLNDVLDPFLAMLNALPRVALAPMFIVWFGIGEASKVAIGVSLVFFIMMISAQSGARGIESEYLRMMRAAGATRYQIFSKVVLAGSVPAIFGGLRLAVVYSLIGVMFGEMLSAEAGLGQRIAYHASVFQTDGVMGILLILAFLALGLNYLVVGLERRLLRWAPSTH